MFLEADEPTLLRRFSETRRPHPLSGREPLALGIRAEREALRGVRRLADAILDTSRFTVHELRDYVRERYDARAESRRMLVLVLSFGYKYGAAAGGGPGVRRALPAEPELRAAAAAADGRRRPGGRVPAAQAGDRGLPAPRAGGSSATCCRATSARAAAT